MDPKTQNPYRLPEQAGERPGRAQSPARETIPMRNPDSFADRAACELKSAVQRQPLTSVVVGFGAGLAMGVAAGCLIAESARPARSHDGFSEKLARVLPDALSEAFEKHFSRS